jgi:hypothetical protein
MNENSSYQYKELNILRINLYIVSAFDQTRSEMKWKSLLIENFKTLLKLRVLNFHMCFNNLNYIFE